MKVHAVKQVWRGIYAVTYTPPRNCGRRYTKLFFRLGTQWMTGERHPTGCYSEYLAEAEPLIAQALNKFAP